MAAPPATRRPRLLIIDDEPLVGRMLCRLLSGLYETTAASSGNAGLQAALGEPWDAILCDIMMPDLSGPELLRKLQQQQHANASKVGFMTGGAFDAETKAFLQRRDEEGWLAKPFTLVEVRAFVEQLCSRTPPTH